MWSNYVRFKKLMYSKYEIFQVSYLGWIHKCRWIALKRGVFWFTHVYINFLQVQLELSTWKVYRHIANEWL